MDVFAQLSREFGLEANEGNIEKAITRFRLTEARQIVLSCMLTLG